MVFRAKTARAGEKANSVMAENTMRKKQPTTALSRTKGDALAASPSRLIRDIRELIEAARQQTAQAVNSSLVMMYWHIGQRIRKDVLQNERAEYGKQIVSTCTSTVSQS